MIKRIHVNTLREMDMLKDAVLMAMTGMTSEEFNRKAQLMRGPKGWGENRYCPVCKKPIHTNDRGDRFCENFSLDYKKNGKCFWHRWKDGTNHWSSPVEVMRAMAVDCPEIAELLKEYSEGVK